MTSSWYVLHFDIGQFNSSSPCAAYIYASGNWVSNGSDNGLSPVRRQAITWTNTDSLSIGFYEHLSQNIKHFIRENVFENVVCKMVGILFRGWGWGEVGVWIRVLPENYAHSSRFVLLCCEISTAGYGTIITDDITTKKSNTWTPWTYFMEDTLYPRVW